jgi:hypothetical protein
MKSMIVTGRVAKLVKVELLLATSPLWFGKELQSLPVPNLQTEQSLLVATALDQVLLWAATHQTWEGATTQMYHKKSKQKLSARDIYWLIYYFFLFQNFYYFIH